MPPSKIRTGNKSVGARRRVSGVLKKVLVVGGGGHARVLIECIAAAGGYRISGLLDPQLTKGSRVHGITVLGGDELLPSLKVKSRPVCAIGVGMVKASFVRRDIFLRLRSAGFALPAFCHPVAYVAGDVVLADGVQIMAGSIVQTGCVVGENAIINTAAVVEHDCQIGPHAHIAPGAVLGGGVIVGAGSHVGLGARVLQKVVIGDRVTVGAGAVVDRDVPDGQVVAGVPARPLK